MWLHTRTEDGFLWTNLPQTTRSTGVAPDGRVIYADLEHLDSDGDGACDDVDMDLSCDGVQNLTELGNFSDGESNIFAIGLGKRYDYGLDFNISYAFQDVEGVTEGASSRGISNWRGIVGTDRNNPSAKISPYQIEHSFKLNLGYEKDFFGTGQSMTRFDVFARRLSGDALSFTFDNDSAGNNHLFGRAGQSEEPFDDDLLYVPTGPSDPLVVYGSSMDAADQQDFFDYLDRNVKGTGIVKANTGRANWNTTMDIRIQQEIPGLPFLRNSLGDNNFRVILDIQNFLNMLNSDWGLWTDGPRFLVKDLIEADLVLASDVAANGIDGATALTLDNPRHNCVMQSDCLYRYTKFNNRAISEISRSKSVYQIRLGVRFDFGQRGERITQ